MIFKLNDRNQAWPTPEILTIKAFNDVWRADGTSTKKTAIKHFTYIYFTHDFKSPFRRTTDKDLIPEKVSSDVLLDKNYYKKIPKAVQEACEVYKELQNTKGLKLFEAAERVVDKTLSYLEGISDKDIGTDFKKISDVLAKMPKLVADLEAARKVVETQMEETKSKTKEGKTLGSRENPKERRY